MPVSAQALKTIKIAGATLVLGSATYLGMLGKWEDGAQAGKGRAVYPDHIARNLPTACYGITRHVTPIPVIVGDYWSPEKCDEVIRAVVEVGQAYLARCIKAPVTQNMFDALSSMGHNVGEANVCVSQAVGAINAGKFDAGCRLIAFRPDGRPNWSISDGKFVQGLHNRRIDEMKLCLKP